jgi:hypothetical protein
LVDFEKEKIKMRGKNYDDAVFWKRPAGGGWRNSNLHWSGISNCSITLNSLILTRRRKNDGQ